MRQSSPFSRFHTLMSLASAMASSMGITLGQALSAQGGYTSRGHGRGSRTPSHANYGRSKYRPHQGVQEVVRRRERIKAGKIEPVYAAFDGHLMHSNCKILNARLPDA